MPKAEKVLNELPYQVTPIYHWLTQYWDQYEVFALQGGTSSGKTNNTLRKLITYAQENPKTRITVAGQDGPNLRVGPFADLNNILDESPQAKAWFNPVKMLETRMIYHLHNGSYFEFKSYSNAQDARSGRREILFVNEADGVPYDIFSELHDRTFVKTIIDWNPAKKFWYHKHLHNDPDVLRIITNFMHNRFCPAKVVKKLLKYKDTNPYRWRVYGLGLQGITEGVIFQNVTFRKPEEWPGSENLEKFGHGSDYGFVKDPLTFVDAGLYQGEIWTRVRFHKTATRLTAFAKWLIEAEIDPLDVIAFDDSQAKEQAEILREDYEYNVKSANRKGGSIMAGIDLLLDYPINIIDDSEGHWAAEQENYTWIKKNGEFVNTKPKDAWNHLWDALRYWALEMLPTPEYEDYKEEYHAI